MSETEVQEVIQDEQVSQAEETSTVVEAKTEIKPEEKSEEKSEPKKKEKPKETKK